MPPQPEGLTASLRFPAAAHWLKSDYGLVARHHRRKYIYTGGLFLPKKKGLLIVTPFQTCLAHCLRLHAGWSGKWPRDETRPAVDSGGRCRAAPDRVTLMLACYRAPHVSRAVGRRWGHWLSSSCPLIWNFRPRKKSGFDSWGLG